MKVASSKSEITKEELILYYEKIADSWIDFKQNAKRIVNAKRKLKDLL